MTEFSARRNELSHIMFHKHVVAQTQQSVQRLLNMLKNLL